MWSKVAGSDQARLVDYDLDGDTGILTGYIKNTDLGGFADLIVEALFKDDDDIHKISANWSICLLYTSPSPRDRQKSRMPSSA